MRIDESGTAAVVAYEYRSATVASRDAALSEDVYADFGWTLQGTTRSRRPGGPAVLRLRRARDLPRRAEVDELQCTAERALRAAASLERSQTRLPAIASWSIGLAGAALLAGSVFALEGGHVAPMVLLGVGGLLLWCLTYPASRLLRRARSTATAPRIEQLRDVVEGAARRARALRA